MPRKTRQEKIIRELRRKLKAAEIKTPILHETSSLKTSSPKIIPQPEEIKLPEIGQLDFIKGDLRKTGILTFFAIVLEFMLYFLIEKGYWQRILKIF